MKERFRPQPENPRHNAPEATSRSLGKFPPLIPEQPPQGGGSKSPELDSSGQAKEVPPAQRGSESTFEQPAKLSKVDAAKTIGVSLGTLYRYIKWGRISVEPEGTIDTAESLRFASARAQQPTLEERAQRQREAQREYTRANREKKRESNRRWRERWKDLKEKGDPRVLALMEANRARRRQRYHERKEQRRLQAEQQQPTQVFPDHPKK